MRSFSCEYNKDMQKPNAAPGRREEITSEEGKRVLNEWLVQLQQSEQRVENHLSSYTDASIAEARRRIDKQREDVRVALGAMDKVDNSQIPQLLVGVLRSMNIENSLLNILEVDPKKVWDNGAGKSVK